MDGPIGAHMLKHYEVVWLPTLLILDHDGHILNKVDRLVHGAELVQIASETLQGEINNNNSQLSSNPFTNEHDKNIDFTPESKEEIIYIYDERESSGRPHIMYHEAYLHLQLMDGKHPRVVKKYLSTQDDWSTEKNIKFIFDFLSDVRSDQFSYFVNNLSRFEEVIGPQKVRRSLSVMINNRLEQGYPRPNLSEAKELYSYLNPATSQELAYRYILKSKKAENRYLEYIQTASEYLNKVNNQDHHLIHQIVLHSLNQSDRSSNLQRLETHMIKAIELDSNQHVYHATLSHIYKLKKDYKKSRHAIENAIRIGKATGVDVTTYQAIFRSLSDL